MKDTGHKKAWLHQQILALEERREKLATKIGQIEYRIDSKRGQLNRLIENEK